MRERTMGVREVFKKRKFHSFLYEISSSEGFNKIVPLWCIILSIILYHGSSSSSSSFHFSLKEKEVKKWKGGVGLTHSRVFIYIYFFFNVRDENKNTTQLISL